jgi:glutamine---fructose-6-phosphate transaminase (isomerizing)
MLREIYEQPQGPQRYYRILRCRGASTAEIFQATVDLGKRERLVIAASGSIRHAGLANSSTLLYILDVDSLRDGARRISQLKSLPI